VRPFRVLSRAGVAYGVPVVIVPWVRAASKLTPARPLRVLDGAATILVAGGLPFLVVALLVRRLLSRRRGGRMQPPADIGSGTIST
jgi:hypothetical protein